MRYKVLIALLLCYNIVMGAARVDNTTNDAIAVGNSDVLDAIDYDQAFTIEFWYYGEQLASANGTFLSKIELVGEDGWYLRTQARDSGERNVEFYAQRDNGSDAILCYGDLNIETYDNVWHHICVTHDGSGIIGGFHFFVDGVITPTKTIGDYPGMEATWVLDNNMFIFNNINLNNSRAGAMAEVRLWNVELSTQQINNVLEGKIIPDTRVIFYQPLDDGQGSTSWIDRSTNGLNGTNCNTVNYFEHPPILWNRGE